MRAGGSVRYSLADLTTSVSGVNVSIMRVSEAGTGGLECVAQRSRHQRGFIDQAARRTTPTPSSYPPP